MPMVTGNTGVVFVEDALTGDGVLGDSGSGTDDLEIEQLMEFSITHENEIIEGEFMGEGYVKKEYGLGNWEGELTFSFKKGSPGHRKFLEAAHKKLKLKGYFVDDRNDLSGNYHYGIMLIEEYEKTNETNELVEYEVSVQGDGELVYVWDDGTEIKASA